MRILLPVDGSAQSKATLRWAAEFLDPAKTQLYLLHVIFWSVDALVRDEEIRAAKTILEDARRFFEVRGFQIAGLDYLLGTPSDTICDYADNNQIDQIIIGSHGHRGLQQVFMGSVSQGVFKQARQPVLVLNNTPNPTLELSRPDEAGLIPTMAARRVLIPIDDSRGSQATLQWVTRFMPSDTTEVHLLTVLPASYGGAASVEIDRAESLLDEAQAYVKHHGFQDVQAHLRYGLPQTIICDFAEEHSVDLILIGSHGTSKMRHFFLGSVTRDVFANAPTPVLVLNNGPQQSLKLSQPDKLDSVRQQS